MATAESRRGRAALMVAHCAGMVDLVALPIWGGRARVPLRVRSAAGGGRGRQLVGDAALPSNLCTEGRTPCIWPVCGGFSVVLLSWRH